MGTSAYLLEAKADPQIKDLDGQTPLDMVRALMEERRSSGLTYVHHLRKKKELETRLNNDDDDADGKKKKAMTQTIKKWFLSKSISPQTIRKLLGSHVLFPLFWLACVTLCVLEYIIDLREKSYDTSPFATKLFEYLVPACLVIFVVASNKDPGIVAPAQRGSSGVETLQRALAGNAKVEPGDVSTDCTRLCTSTWIIKDLRTKYCSQTKVCIREFDHYCVWLNCSIGRGNHREFVVLAFVEWFTQLSHAYLLWCVGTTLVEYVTIWSYVTDLLTGRPVLCLALIAHMFTIPWVLMLILHQFRLTMMNLTTNEMLNLHRYDHFWDFTVDDDEEFGKHGKTFRNPLTRVGWWRNVFDFWWARRRSEFRSKVHGRCVSHECCKDHVK